MLASREKGRPRREQQHRGRAFEPTCMSDDTQDPTVSQDGGGAVNQNVAPIAPMTVLKLPSPVISPGMAVLGGTEFCGMAFAESVEPYQGPL